MIDSLVAFSKSPLGEVAIRITCIFFVGAIGAQSVVMKFADLFELFAKGKNAKAKIEAIAKIVGMLGCIFMSVLTSSLYSGDRAMGFIIAEGTLYGVGALGLYVFLVTGKLKTLLQSIRGKNGGKK